MTSLLVPIDPLVLQETFWPEVSFYAEQRQTIYSVEENEETYVSAGNQLGKDYVAGYICLQLFLRCIKAGKSCRIVTTSVAEHHLKVLWAEIVRFIMTSKHPLLHHRGGPLVVNHMEIRRAAEMDAKNPVNYLVGRVSEKGEGLAGHHAEVTLFVADEASGVADTSYAMAQGWAKRMLIFGNPNDCDNFFRKGISEGDLKSNDGSRYHRKCIRIKAEDSPNVKLALIEQRKGLAVSNRELVPGVLSYQEYIKRRATWDKIRQCVGLDAEFYEGAELKLFPQEWLVGANEVAARLNRNRKAKAIGIDPAEGGDQTAMAAVDELGLIELVARKTPDTAIITSEALAFTRKHGCSPEQVCFDAGGGGKQHVDRLRQMGFKVRAVAFGESVVPEPKRRTVTPLAVKVDQREDKYAYVNRRAEMYGELSLLLDPSMNPRGFGIARSEVELLRQLKYFAKKYDAEGRLRLPPKNRKGRENTEKTLTELMGCSPDQADALALAVWSMHHKAVPSTAGAVA